MCAGLGWATLLGARGYLQNASAVVRQGTRGGARGAGPDRDETGSRNRSDRKTARLLVDPDVLHAPVVIDAVDLLHDALHMRLPAGRPAIMEDDRARSVLLQLMVDLPYEL